MPRQLPCQDKASGFQFQTMGRLFSKPSFVDQLNSARRCGCIWPTRQITAGTGLCSQGNTSRTGGSPAFDASAMLTLSNIAQGHAGRLEPLLSLCESARRFGMGDLARLPRRRWSGSIPVPIQHIRRSRKSTSRRSPAMDRAVGTLTATALSGRHLRADISPNKAEFVGNPPKVLALVLRNRGNGDLKCSAKNDVCRMLNPCDVTTVGNRSA
jgi:hypothetical protein